MQYAFLWVFRASKIALLDRAEQKPQAISIFSFELCQLVIEVHSTYYKHWVNWWGPSRTKTRKKWVKDRVWLELITQVATIMWSQFKSTSSVMKVGPTCSRMCNFCDSLDAGSDVTMYLNGRFVRENQLQIMSSITCFKSFRVWMLGRFKNRNWPN